MPAFVPPVDAPSEWSFALTRVELADGLRYGGYRVPALQLTRRGSEPGRVISPVAGVRRNATGSPRWIEIEAFPGTIRRVLARMPFGAPTICVQSDDIVDALEDGVAQRAQILLTRRFVLALPTQSRLALHPLHACAAIEEAMRTGGGTPAPWGAFVTAIRAALPAPLMLTDHAGEPVSTAMVRLTTGSGARIEVPMASADGGDVVAAMRRMRASDRTVPDNPWDGGGRVVLSLAPPPRTGASGSGSMQVAQVDLAGAATGAAGEVTITRETAICSATDLEGWFAPQFVRPPALARFTRGNRIVFFQNGQAFFDDWFRVLATERFGPGDGLHHAGWVNWDAELVGPLPGVTATRLSEAVRGVVDGGADARILLSRFFQLDSTGATLPIVAPSLLGLIALLYTAGRTVGPATSDAAVGGLLLGWAALIVAFRHIDRTSAAVLEPNHTTSDAINGLPANAGRPAAVCVLSAHPMQLADNWRFSLSEASLPENYLFSILNRVSVHHQKFSVLKSADKHVAYYGGIDLLPQQRDDVHHLPHEPFHDVQARVQGPAVKDIAQTFQERWSRDGVNPSGTAVPAAFPVPRDAAALAAEPQLAPDAPLCAMQVARTYFGTTSDHAFGFAPNGDRTILDTVLNALRNAREFVFLQDQYLTPPGEFTAALTQAAQRVRSMTLVVPGQTDVPFGDPDRDDFVAAMHAATAARPGVLRVVYPRRTYTLPDTAFVASGGRLFLGEDMLSGTSGHAETIVLGPRDRVPPPPFWVCVQGEVMRVTGEAAPTERATADRRIWTRYTVERGPRGVGLDPTAQELAGPPALRDHEAETEEWAGKIPVSVVDFTRIYVHCKLLIVDDVFISHGSANTNRRGFYSDGELNVFTIPEALRLARDNPIAALRRRLWCEHLDLPAAVGEPLMTDPAGASSLMDRSPLLGNRLVDLRTRPPKLLWNLGPGDSALGNALSGLLFGLQVGASRHLYRSAGDPSSLLEPRR